MGILILNLLILVLSAAAKDKISFSKNLLNSLSSSNSLPLSYKCNQELINLNNNKNFTNIYLALSGTKLNDLGKFKDCEDIDNWKYFMLEVNYRDFWIFNQTYSIGVCLPAACEVEDLYSIRWLIQEALLPIIEGEQRIKQPKEEQVTFRDVRKENNKQLRISRGLEVFLWVTGGLLCLSILTSFPSCTKWTRYQYLFQCFSLVDNMRNIYEKVQRENKSEEGLKCLHGIKVILAFLVVFGHTLLYMGTFGPSKDISLGVKSDPANTNLSTLAIDLFFLISGFLSALGFIRSLTEHKTGRIRLIYRSYISRYIRLLGIMIATLLIYTYILPVLHDASFSYIFLDFGVNYVSHSASCISFTSKHMN